MRAMQDTENLDPPPFNAIDRNVRGAADDQLARSFHAAFATNQRVPCKHINLPLYLFIEPGRSGGVVLRDIVQLLKPGTGRGLEPANGQTLDFAEEMDLLRQAARLIKL